MRKTRNLLLNYNWKERQKKKVDNAVLEGAIFGILFIAFFYAMLFIADFLQTGG